MIGDRARASPTNNGGGPGCWHALLWLQDLHTGMCTSVEVGDEFWVRAMQVHDWRGLTAGDPTGVDQ